MSMPEFGRTDEGTSASPRSSCEGAGEDGRYARGGLGKLMVGTEETTGDGSAASFSAFSESVGEEM